jgi:uridine kinase
MQNHLEIPSVITVVVRGQEYVISRGTRVKAFLRRYLPDIAPECLGAIVGNRVVDLEAPIASSCELVPVTYASKAGARIYRATVTVMLCEAFARLFPSAKLRIGQALGDGYYFDVEKDPLLTQEDIRAVEAEMRRMVERKEPLVTMRVPAAQAIEIFEMTQQKSKVMTVKAMRTSYVNIVTMGKHWDLVFHPLLPTTEGIKEFRLSLYANGLVLGFPPPGKATEPPAPPKNHWGLFSVYRETRDWNRALGIETVGDLNKAIVEGKIGEVIRVAEALHERKIVAISDEIARRKGRCRLVLVAGPSASGKTTFIKRLRLQLLALGIRPKELSIDNYYVNRKDTPRDESGDYDFECLEAIDLGLLNEQLEALLAGKMVKTPIYSFTKGVRSSKTIPMKLEQDEILLMEGIHGLNDKLTAAVPREQKFRIYVSAITQLCIDEHNRIFTSDVRLLRRIVRDRLFRGYTAEETINRWPKVRAGEEKHIYPFQDMADMMFNSTLVYETALLKVFAERFLMEVREDSPAFPEAWRLLEFLHLFVPIFPDDVPSTSILREFIGGSAFEY